MKKLLLTLLALILALALPLAAVSELGLDETGLTLPEKLKKQIADGSGVKGTLTLEISGDTFLGALLGDGLHEAKIDFGYILTDKLTGASQTNVSITDEELVVATIGADIDAQTILMTGSLFGEPRKVDIANLFNAFLPNNGPQGLTAWEPMLYKLFFSGDNAFNEDIKKVLEPYGVQLELWLGGHAAISERTEDGVIEIAYEISFRDVAEEMKALLEGLLQDAALRALLEKKLSKAELDTYFRPDALEIYKIVLDNVNVEGHLIVKQQMNTREPSGKMEFEIPMAENAYGIDSVQISTAADANRFSITGGMGKYTLQYKKAEDGVANGLFLYEPATTDGGAVPLSIAFDFFAEHKEWTDEEKKTNATDTLRLSVSPDLEAMKGTAFESEYLEFEPVSFVLEAAYRSGAAKTSATTVNVVLKEMREDVGAQLTLAGKTTSQWQTEQRDWENAVSISLQDGIDALKSGVMSILGHFTPAMLAQ